MEKPFDGDTLRHVIGLVEGYIDTSDSVLGQAESKLTDDVLREFNTLRSELHPQLLHALTCDQVGAAMRSLKFQLDKILQRVPPDVHRDPTVKTKAAVAFRSGTIEVGQEAFDEPPGEPARPQPIELRPQAFLYSSHEDIDQYRRTVMIERAHTVDIPPPLAPGLSKALRTGRSGKLARVWAWLVNFWLRF